MDASRRLIGAWCGRKIRRQEDLNSLSRGEKRKPMEEEEKEIGRRKKRERQITIVAARGYSCGVQLIKTIRPFFVKVIKTRSKKASRSGSVHPRGCHWRLISARQIRSEAFAFACAKSVLRAGKKRSLKGIYKWRRFTGRRSANW